MVAKGILESGYSISGPYLSQLRTGVRTNPSDEIIVALANYFRVAPDYFFAIPQSGDRAQVQQENADIVDSLVDPIMRRSLVAANRLSAESLELPGFWVGKLRIFDHRHIIPADSHPYVCA